jgi:hypothetical protein
MTDDGGGTPKWRIYEAAIAQLKEAYDDCDVILDHRVQGRRSGVSRQVDIWLSRRMGGHTVTVAVECKRRESRPVDIQDVDGFYGFLDDVGASKGVIVSTTGFTDGARRRADQADVELQTLTVEEALAFDWDDYTEVASCQNPNCLTGTITWKEWLSADAGGQEPPHHIAGHCFSCGLFHIQCGECGTIDSYEPWGSGTVKCSGGCGTRWWFAFEKGDVTRFGQHEADDEDEDDEG